jgi:Flp pilus assembly protein TadD
VAALALAAHARSLGGEFVSWDDDRYVTTNPDVRYPTPSSLAQLLDPRSLVLREWTPVVTASFAVEHALFGLDPLPYHATNCLLHSATSAGVVLLFTTVGAPVSLAAGAGALFAVHPLQVESVAWVSARKNLLALLFSLASLIVYARGRTRRATAASLLLFVLALGSKGTAVVLPLWLLGYRLTAGRRDGDRVVGIVIALLPFFALAVARGLWSMHTQADVVGPTTARGLGGRLAVMGPVFVTYLRQLFWPVGLSADYPWPPMRGTDPRVLYSWAIIALVALGIGAMAWRDRRVALAACMAAAGLFPTANLIPAPYLQADRYTHMALVGVSYLVVAACVKLSRPLHSTTPAAVAGLAWMALILVPETWARTATWRSACTLWRDTVVHSPTNATARANLGLCVLDEGDLEGAEQEYRRALVLDPSHATAWNNLGALMLRRERREEARDAYMRAVALDPRSAPMHRNLAKAYEALGEFERAESQLNLALQLDPRAPIAYSGLGFLLMRQGRREEAEAVLRRGLAIRETPDLHNNLAWLLVETGRPEEGREHALRSVEMGPESAVAWDTLGVALARVGQQKEAREAFEQALSLNPELTAASDHLREELTPL